MQVSRVNKVFARLGRFQIKFRWLILLATILVTLAACLGLPQLQMTSSEEEWFDDWDKVKIDQAHFNDVFGSDDGYMVMVRANDVFAPEVLSAIDRLSKRLENEVPYADRVVSLTHNLSIPIANNEGFEVIDPFESGIPTDSAQLAAKKSLIMSRESLVNNIVSDDAKETWVILSLKSYEGGIDFGKDSIAPFARNVILSDEFKSDKFEMLPTGMSYTEMEENEVISRECAMRIIIGFAVMLACLILFVRSLRGVIVPAIATVGGIASVLGVNAWLGIIGDESMVALPVLLGMALSVGYSIHYINSFRMHFRRTGNRRESVINAVEETGWPILFTVITTVASLISFLFAGIRPIRWIGGISAGIVFMVYLYVIILIPILMSFGKNAKPDPTDVKAAGATKADILFEFFGRKVCRHSGIVAAISAAIMLAQIPGVMNIDVNMDYTKTMGEKIPFVTRLMDMLSGKLGSLYDFNVMIEFNESDALKNPANMKRIETLEQKLGTLQLTKISGDKPRVQSVTRLVKEMNRTLNADSTEYYKIPNAQDMLTQLLFLYEISDADALFERMDEDYKTTFIHIELSGYDAKKIVEDLDSAKSYAAQIFPDAKTSIVGEVVNYAEMNGKLVNGLLRSFGGSFVIIAIMMILAFGSIKAGLIGMIPNVAPVLLIGGVMGYSGMPLDMITMIVMPMILGIAVDDTIHMNNHIKYGYERTGSYKKALLLSYREIGKTMGMTTFILCAMFFVFIFSPMGALHNVGLLSIIGLAAALVADYTLTTALVYVTKPYGKEKR
ncbi:MAG: MMPL family transporter [Fibrobacter sp.]|uniref:efflux RND transporter permease subunit n=1 Tax=Fibrobacter sp. TaxID=35828 RepID=UPI0025C3010F|nr:MMPL family transporter [Fibrobacter sp.]MBQ7078275.1 MMPL family transporter [Fibrobacter sp.]